MVKKILSAGIVCNPNIIEREKDFIVNILKLLKNLMQKGKILVDVSLYRNNEIRKFFKNDVNIKEAEIKDMNCDIIIVLGGDGTILYTMDTIQNVPVLGINLGKFGFLTEINKDDAFEKLNALFEGKFFIEDYDMLNVNNKYECVNEVVISYKFPARIMNFSVKINNKKNEDVIEFSADGVVVATQTGSTAYSLSLGGPVIHPSTNAFVITPMNPFLRNAKPLVVPSDSEIFINIDKANEDVFLIIDGKVAEKVSTGDKIFIKKSNNKARFVRFEKTMRCAKIFM